MFVLQQPGGHLMKLRALAVLLLSAAIGASAWAGEKSPELCLSAQGLGLYPFGDLATVAYAAAGGSLGIEARNVPIDRLSLALDIDYLEFIPALSGIASMRDFAAILSSGYSFPLSSSLSLTPRLGGGFGYASVVSDWSTEAGGQAFAVAQVELDWAINPWWRVGLSLGYRGIAETTAWYSTADARLGVSYKLPSPSVEK
jgi:hypothetical protein